MYIYYIYIYIYIYILVQFEEVKTHLFQQHKFLFSNIVEDYRFIDWCKEYWYYLIFLHL